MRSVWAFSSARRRQQPVEQRDAVFFAALLQRFRIDIREGDEFSVLYEQKYQDGHYVSDGKILAAELPPGESTWASPGSARIRGSSRERSRALNLGK